MLLPISGEICKKMFDLLCKHLDDNLLNSNQSGLHPGNSCVHQPLAINNICKAFKAKPSLEVRDVFLGLSKVFDGVWNAELIYKLKHFRISGKYSGLINSFLSNQYQRAVFNGQSSYWSQVIAVVLQDSILGPLLF